MNIGVVNFQQMCVPPFLAQEERVGLYKKALFIQSFWYLIVLFWLLEGLYWSSEEDLLMLLERHEEVIIGWGL